MKGGDLVCRRPPPTGQRAVDNQGQHDLKGNARNSRGGSKEKSLIMGSRMEGECDSEKFHPQGDNKTKKSKKRKTKRGGGEGGGIRR